MRIVVLAVFLLVSQEQVGAQSLASNSVNFFSIKQDIEIGAAASNEAERVLPIARDAYLTQYVTAIGQRLAHAVPLPELRFRFRIVNSKRINSLGLPGGSVYVNRGLIDLSSNDDELAAILAHEIGHIASRHGTVQLSRQLLIQAPISIATGLPTTDAWKEQLAKLGISYGVNSPFLRYSRDQEIEANLVAIRLLAGARFDPNALLSVLEKVNETRTGEDAQLSAFAFNHPQSETLTEEIENEIMQLSPQPHRHTGTSAEFRAFHAALDRIAYPAPDKEVAEPAPLDSALPNVFTHPQNYFRFGYPAGWKVARTGPDGAIIAPVEGVQPSPNGDDVTHGVMFDLFDISGRPLTIEQATNRLIVFLRQRNQSLRVVPGAQTQMLVSDDPGLRTVLIGKSSATGSTEVVWVVTRIYYKSLFYMVFVAPEDEFPTYEPVFVQMIHSTRFR